MLNRKLLNKRKAKVVLSEMVIEAHLSHNVAHLKYKDKEMMTEQRMRKRDHLIAEFKNQILSFWLHKKNIEMYEFDEAIAEEEELRLIYD